MVPLTFQVDMSQENISLDGVHIAGDFQSAAGFGGNWDPSTSAMSDPDGDMIFSINVMVPTGTYFYKFINGDSWSDKPELPSADCAIDDGGGNFNRRITVGSNGLTLPSVVFDSCNAVLHFSVNMSMETVSPSGVHVMGNFQEAAGYSNNWNPTSVLLEDINGDGTYETEIQISPGTYQYLFLNGNSLLDAENPPTSCTVDDGNGNFYRNITAEIEGIQGPIYCFNSCTFCDPGIDTNYDTYWWNDAVFYEVFLRSFYDSDNDGIGDFQGLIQKLDYLNDGDPNTDTDLGITGIWLMPMMESPSYHGYDVSSYFAVEQDYGSMADFEELLDSAHARGIKVIIDFVMNHSSTQNTWFTQSANNQNGFRDWYVWSNTNPGFSGPWGQNVWHNWGGNYYYGLFWGGMPDLNYSHPPLRSAMFSVAEFWLDKGADGFRLDAIKYLDEDGTVLENTPETFQILEEFNMVYKTKNPDAFTVGEVWSNTASILPYVQNDRLDVCFEFDLANAMINGINQNTPSSISNQLQTIQATYPKLQYATFLTNHDIDRIFSQFGNDEDKMKQAASLYLSLPGIPFIYYGEELGMTGTGAHENIRRPMQWTAGPNAGFSTQSPWYPIGTNYPSNNVTSMESNPNSLLSYYKKLIHLRNDHAPLRKGYLLSLDNAENDILSFARIYEEEAVILLSNFSNQPLNSVITMATSSLPAGNYQVTELYSQSNWGTLTLNANGGFTNWQATNQDVMPRESWAILLSQHSVAIDPNLSAELEIQLFPNPSTQNVQLRWAKETHYPTDIEVIDITGKRLLITQFTGNSSTLAIEDLTAGIYFIKIIYQGNSKVLRWVVK